MPDHIHVFVSAEGSQGLSRWVGALKRNLAAVRRGFVVQTHNGAVDVGRPCMAGVKPAGGITPANNCGYGSDVGRPCAGGGIETPPGMQPRPTMEADFVGRPCAGGGIFSGRAWQAGFFDHVLRSSESYGEKWEYVRMNPVRAGLAARPEDWPYAGEIEALRW